ncbi:MAG: hypothetical protein NWE98_07025 [Candidatus Bathyarchaeota archaeon]|nr:hypothetical protein [Candidatus Bathyarchaeota archaeon]
MKKTLASLHRLQIKIEEYTFENWGFPFIAGFLVLLFAASLFLAAGISSIAESLANWSYFALLFGVILQIAHFGKNRRKR